MLFPQKGIAEGELGRDPIFPRQCQRRLGIAVLRPDTAAAPDAIRRSAIEGTNFAPIVKILPVLAVQRQKNSIQVVKFKQAGEMVVGDAFLGGHQVGSFGHCDHPICKKQPDKAVFESMWLQGLLLLPCAFAMGKKRRFIEGQSRQKACPAVALLAS